MISRILKLALGLFLFGVGSSPAFATNQVKLKPDGNASAPCTVFGAPSNGMSCGKTTAPNATIDNVGSTALGAPGTANTAGSGNLTDAKFISFNGPHSLTVGRVGTANTPTGGIYVSTTIPIISEYMTIISSGGNIKMTSTPTITTMTAAGIGLTVPVYLTITSTDAINTITLQDNDTLSNSLLELGAGTRALSAKKVLRLHFDPDLGKWIEDSYGGN